MVHIAHHGKVGRHAVHRISHNVEMLASLQRYINADGAGEIARPHAAGDYHLVGFDDAFCGFNAGSAAVLDDDFGDECIFMNGHAAHARALGQGHRRINRIALAVGRIPDSGNHIVNIHERPFGLRFLGRNLVRFNVESTQHRSGTGEFLPTLRIGSNRDRTGLNKAGGLSRFFLQIGVEIDRVFSEPRQVLRIERGAHKPRRMPCRAAGEALALQKHNVFHTKLAEMIGGGTTDNAASHDNNRSV